MRRAVIVILDGLRRDMVTEEHTPRLVAFSHDAEQFKNHRTTFPSATRVVAASFATGCYPARHELQGNSMALIENGRIVVHDAGHPDFLQHKRRVTGCSLAVPTLAERVENIGGAVLLSNVSPGATYAHDPDGKGYVYHRAGSFGPGRAMREPDGLPIGPDIAGDRVLTERFVNQVLAGNRFPLSVLWLGHPDTTQHDHALGSPEHLAALRQADGHADLVIGAVEELREAGDDVLLIVGSDHGHQTVVGVIDVEAELIDAGLKDAPDSADVVSISNGTAALIYVDQAFEDRTTALHEFLRSRDWAEHVVSADRLGTVGQAPHQQLAFAVSLRSSAEANSYGVPGCSLVAKPTGKPDRFGCGQHGGLGVFEQSPFLMINGPRFKAGEVRDDPTSIVDIAPTILGHLGLDALGMDGNPLSRHA
jgi:arylsulfatase A-like enzyme